MAAGSLLPLIGLTDPAGRDSRQPVTREASTVAEPGTPI